MKHVLAPAVQASLEGRWEQVYRSQLHYLVTWATRGRRGVLRPRHVRALQELIQSAADERGIALIETSVAPDHVHVLFALRPAQSVAGAVRELKGRTSVAMLERFPELRVWLRGNLIWEERYAVETVSAARVGRVHDRLRARHGLDEEMAAAS